MKNLVRQKINYLFDTFEDRIFLPTVSNSIRRKARISSNEVLGTITEDLTSYVERDPSLLGEATCALVPNSPYIAVLCHRIAHHLWNYESSVEGRHLAMTIAHFGRVQSGADIHPAARIGRRFVLDHGTNTVIGATCIIGDDCYVLNGVILGARGISGNAPEKRHPTLGNRVEVGSFARILGNVHIGDDAFIGPHSVVTRDIPEKTCTRYIAEVEKVGLSQSQELYDAV